MLKKCHYYMPAVTIISPEIKYRENSENNIAGEQKQRTYYEKSAHKAIQNVTSNNDKLRNISIIRLNNISIKKSVDVHMQCINVLDIAKSKQMTIKQIKHASNQTKAINAYMQYT